MSGRDLQDQRKKIPPSSRNRYDRSRSRSRSRSVSYGPAVGGGGGYSNAHSHNHNHDLDHHPSSAGLPRLGLRSSVDTSGLLARTPATPMVNLGATDPGARNDSRDRHHRSHRRHHSRSLSRDSRPRSLSRDSSRVHHRSRSPLGATSRSSRSTVTTATSTTASSALAPNGLSRTDPGARNAQQHHTHHHRHHRHHHHRRRHDDDEHETSTLHRCDQSYEIENIRDPQTRAHIRKRLNAQRAVLGSYTDESALASILTMPKLSREDYQLLADLPENLQVTAETVRMLLGLVAVTNARLRRHRKLYDRSKSKLAEIATGVSKEMAAIVAYLRAAKAEADRVYMEKQQLHQS